jgi:hypothetical protein
MKTKNHTVLDLPQLGLLIALLCGTFLLAACGGNKNPPPVEEIQPATQALEVLPPTDQSSPAEEPVPTSEPADSQEAAPSPQPIQTEAAAPEASIDACLLLTQDDAAAALGKAVGEPVREAYPMLSSCTYTSEDLDGVTIVVVEYESSQDAAASFQMELDINGYEEISGIGERALRPYPVMDLSALQENFEVSIDLWIGDPDNEYLLARDLMETALTRLP